MDASPLFTPAQPMLRAARNASDDSSPPPGAPTTRRSEAASRSSEPAAVPDNIVVPGFLPPSRDPLTQQVLGPRPGWAGTGPSNERMPVVVPARRSRLVPASFIFTVLGVFAGGAALLRLDAGDAMLAGIASALAVVLLILSSALAIGGIVVALRRRTGRFGAVLALLVAFAALAGALYLAAGQVLELQLPSVFG